MFLTTSNKTIEFKHAFLIFLIKMEDIMKRIFLILSILFIGQIKATAFDDAYNNIPASNLADKNLLAQSLYYLIYVIPASFQAHKTMLDFQANRTTQNEQSANAASDVLSKAANNLIKVENNPSKSNEAAQAFEIVYQDAIKALQEAEQASQKAYQAFQAKISSADQQYQAALQKAKQAGLPTFGTEAEGQLRMTLYQAAEKEEQAAEQEYNAAVQAAQQALIAHLQSVLDAYEKVYNDLKKNNGNLQITVGTDSGKLLPDDLKSKI
jgi:hypothetical protein